MSNYAIQAPAYSFPKPSFSHENKMRALVLLVITLMFGLAGSLGMALTYGLGAAALHGLTAVLEKEWPGVETAEPRRRRRRFVI